MTFLTDKSEIEKKISKYDLKKVKHITQTLLFQFFFFNLNMDLDVFLKEI